MSDAPHMPQDPSKDDCDCPPNPDFTGFLVRDMPIVNRKGLHARATAKFVQCVERFEAEITVTRCGETVGGSSIMGILTLGAGVPKGDFAVILKVDKPSPLYCINATFKIA